MPWCSAICLTLSFSCCSSSKIYRSRVRYAGPMLLTAVPSGPSSSAQFVALESGPNEVSITHGGLFACLLLVLTTGLDSLFLPCPLLPDSTRLRNSLLDTIFLGQGELCRASRIRYLCLSWSRWGISASVHLGTWRRRAPLLLGVRSLCHAWWNTLALRTCRSPELLQAGEQLLGASW